MFVWALLFLAFAFLSALFGFTGIGPEAAFFAKVAFIVTLVASGVTYVLSQSTKRA
jgi:uncharacterized membrane protein YtjA (UPF0391 family)